MGQREGIIVWLIGGGIVLPLIVLALLASLLGGAAFPIALAGSVSGITFLVLAKWRLVRSGKWLSFGTRQLTVQERRFYWIGYGLIVCGLVLALIAAPFH